MVFQTSDIVVFGVVLFGWVLLAASFVRDRRRRRREEHARTGLRAGLARLTYRGEHRL